MGAAGGALNTGGAEEGQKDAWEEKLTVTKHGGYVTQVRRRSDWPAKKSVFVV